LFLHYIQIINDPDVKLSKVEKQFYQSEGDQYFDLALLTCQIPELNADRIGLLTCGDFDASALAAVKMNGGGFDRYGYYKIEAYLNQAKEIIKKKDFTIDDVRSSHPLSPLRVYALEIFSNSKEYKLLEQHKQLFQKKRQVQVN